MKSPVYAEHIEALRGRLKTGDLTLGTAEVKRIIAMLGWLPDSMLFPAVDPSAPIIAAADNGDDDGDDDHHHHGDDDQDGDAA
jgi:hypothetical protein